VTDATGTAPNADVESLAYDEAFAEYQRMFRNAGFARSELHDLPGTVQRAVISYK